MCHSFGIACQVLKFYEMREATFCFVFSLNKCSISSIMYKSWWFAKSAESLRTLQGKRRANEKPMLGVREWWTLSLARESTDWILCHHSIWSEYVWRGKVRVHVPCPTKRYISRENDKRPLRPLATLLLLGLFTSISSLAFSMQYFQMLFHVLLPSAAVGACILIFSNNA